MTSGARSKRYGVVSHEQRHAMSGLEFVQCLVSGTLPLNNMAETLGYDIVEATSGRVAITAMPTSRHLNPAGGVHGGLAATLLDSCMGCAVHTTLPAGVGYATTDLQVRYIRAMSADTGRVLAEGSVIHLGSRTATAEGRLSAEADGRLIAHASTGCVIFR